MNPEKAIRDILGAEAASTFAFMCSNIDCMIKALALADLSTPISEIRIQIEKAAQTAITAAVEAFLQTEYPSMGGGMGISVGDNAVYDQHMNAIEPFQKLQKHQVEIVSQVVEDYLVIFSQGRDLAQRMAERNNAYVHARNYVPEISPARDYSLRPPFEFKSIEIMRLERKMPDLSDEEKARLRDLYRKD